MPLLAAAAVLLVVWLPAVISGHSSVVSGERYWWLSDDAMISMRYARNLAGGAGLVWNPGERVEGYTNFLWTLYMAAAHLTPLPAAKTALVILLTNVLIGLASLPVIARLARALGGGDTAVVFSLAAFALCEVVSKHAVEGFETALLSFLVLLISCYVVEESSVRPRLFTYLLIGVLPLVRADAAVLSALFYLAGFFSSGARGRVAKYTALSMALPAAHETFRVAYYGEYIPNTAYLKSMYWDEKYLVGIRYVARFFWGYFPVVAFAAAGAAFSRRRIYVFLALLFFVFSAYVAYAGGDVFAGYRFFSPVFPLLAVMAFAGVEAALSGLNSARVRPYLGAALCLLCLLSMRLVIPVLTNAVVPERSQVGNIKIALLLRDKTPKDSRVAAFYAGTVFYFSDRYAIDLLGKSDKHVARLRVTPESGTRQGHNKFDYNYSLGVLKPDFVVAPFKAPVGEAEMQKRLKSDSTFAAWFYYNPVFRTHYIANALPADTWRTVYVSDWFLAGHPNYISGI